MKVTAIITNLYVGGPRVITKKSADIPPPPDGDRDQWAYDHLFSLTGTGREEGDAAYFLTITECDDPDLIGAQFEWGT